VTVIRIHQMMMKIAKIYIIKINLTLNKHKTIIRSINKVILKNFLINNHSYKIKMMKMTYKINNKINNKINLILILFKEIL
jgi:hypothetical protein